jgi:hypothetical protein
VPTIFGEINGDGVVNGEDHADVLERIGTRLPPVSRASIVSNAVVQGAPQLVRIGTTRAAKPASASQSRPHAEVRLAGRGWSLGTAKKGNLVSQRLT